MGTPDFQTYFAGFIGRIALAAYPSFPSISKHSCVLPRAGPSFEKRYFCTMWAKTMDDAGLEDLHFPHLRGTAATRLFGANCKASADGYQHETSLKTVSTIPYKHLARTRALTDQAIFRWGNLSQTKFATKLQTGSTYPKGETRV